MSSQKTIFILGATGYIGSTITEFAVASGYVVRGLSRSETGDAKLVALGATPVRGDLSTLDVLTREAAAADITINLADALIGSGYTMSQEERNRISNTAIDAIVAGMKGSGKPLIITSGSLVVPADPEGKETNEDSPTWPEDSPFRPSAELYARATKDLGIRVCAIRLAPFVYGKGGSGVQLFMGMFAGAGKAFWVDEGKACVTTVHVEDAARLYLLAAEKGRAGECYNATYETNVTHRELAEAIAAAIGVEVKKQSYEDTKNKMGLFFAEFLRAENKGSNQKAKRELGWEIKAEKGILDEIKTGSYVQVAEEIKKGAGKPAEH
jgi:nucleoside-diphosphate-sugar epimerase